MVAFFVLSSKEACYYLPGCRKFFWKVSGRRGDIVNFVVEVSNNPYGWRRKRAKGVEVNRELGIVWDA